MERVGGQAVEASRRVKEKNVQMNQNNGASSAEFQGDFHR